MAVRLGPLPEERSRRQRVIRNALAGSWSIVVVPKESSPRPASTSTMITFHQGPGLAVSCSKMKPTHRARELLRLHPGPTTPPRSDPRGSARASRFSPAPLENNVIEEPCPFEGDVVVTSPGMRPPASSAMSEKTNRRWEASGGRTRAPSPAIEDQAYAFVLAPTCALRSPHSWRRSRADLPSQASDRPIRQRRFLADARQLSRGILALAIGEIRARRRILVWPLAVPGPPCRERRPPQTTGPTIIERPPTFCHPPVPTPNPGWLAPAMDETPGSLRPAPTVIIVRQWCASSRA